MVSGGDSKISRRSFIGSVGAVSACSGLGVVSSATARGAGNGRKGATAFALVGDRFHNSDYIRTALGKTLVREAGLSIDFTDEVTALSSETLRNYRMLIIFRDAHLYPMGYGPNHWWGGYQMRPDSIDSVKCVEQDWYPGYKKFPQLKIVSVPPVPDYQPEKVCWMTEEQGLAVKRFVKGGGAAFFYHNSTYNALDNRHFRDVLGAFTLHHPPIRPFKVKVVNPDHPIMRGVNDFIITDEQHFAKYNADPSAILARSVNEDGLAHRDHGLTADACWAFDYGKGRVCYMSPGHTIDALWNPEYEKMQRNAVRWLLREI